MTDKTQTVLSFGNITLSRTLVLYVLIGGSASLVDMIGFLTFFNLFALPAVASTMLSVSIATVYSFILNSRFNFKVSDRLQFRFLLFSLVSVSGLLLSAFALAIFHDQFGFDGNFVKILSLPAVFVLQFLLNKHITFKLKSYAN